MAFERFYEERDLKSIKNKCTCYLYYDAILVLDDGSMITGIIEEVDDQNVGILVGQDMHVDEDEERDMSRQPMGYNRYNRYRRYGRRNYPINRINRVGLLPYPIYPVYPPYPIYPYPFFPL